MSSPSTERQVQRAIACVLDLDKTDPRVMQITKLLLEMREEATAREGLEPGTSAAWERYRKLLEGA